MKTIFAFFLYLLHTLLPAATATVCPAWYNSSTTSGTTLSQIGTALQTQSTKDTLSPFILLDSVDWIGDWRHSCLNTKNINTYSFNTNFANHFENNSRYNGSTMDQICLKTKLRRLESLALRGTLKTLQKAEWQAIATQMIYSFGNDTAAMVYHQARQKWVACGWIDLSNTFVNENAVTRMCTSILSLGLTPPRRRPQEGKDYLLERITKPHRPGSPHKPRPSNQPDTRDKSNILPTSIRSDYGEEATYVDLFSGTDSCEKGDDSDSCVAFCCLSAYSASSFCESGSCH